MTKLRFDYIMRINYSLPVSKCYFTIKCIPKNTARQRLLDINISMDPKTSYTYSEDGFGNLKIIGVVDDLHNSYTLDVSGNVEIGQVLYEDVAYNEKIAVFKYPYGKTIPARYVTGFMIGEGQSHAWAEILFGDKWIGMDPTNNLLIDDNYIKLSHGRDAADCKINLGIMIGGGEQAQQIKVSVTKLMV